MLGTFELSVRDGDAYAIIGKVAMGITDETLAELTELLESHVTGENEQDVTIVPTVVFEGGYEELQRSPTYDSGYALRFPRFIDVRGDLDVAGTLASSASGRNSGSTGPYLVHGHLFARC